MKGIPWILLSTSLSVVYGSKHEHGVCALYGDCGKKSLFGSELPCPNQVIAEIPDDDTSKLLIEVCGETWKDSPVCCDQKQVQSLKSNLKKAESIIASCPACKENFFQFFCRFTCSPDQSTFVNVTKISKSTSKQDVVTELDHYVDPQFASDFYDSCKEVKFSATNGRAMDFIGGGAKDYKAFLKFLGDEKPLLGGSPFQMNFPWDSTPDEITRHSAKAWNCYDSEFKCACSDCAASCPELPKISPPNSCTVGALPCLSFAILVSYAGALLLAILCYAGYLLWQKQAERNLESRRLLYAEDEDEEEQDYFSGLRFGVDRLRGPYKINTILQAAFTKSSFICASHPWSVIGISILVVGALLFGLFRLHLETSPVRLWVSPNSQEYAEKQFFDDNFGPFYRAEQVYLVNDTGPVMSYETLQWWFDVENRVRDVTSSTGDRLQDLCLKPLGDDCVVQSVTQYFGGDIGELPESQWRQKIAYCTRNPVECLPPFQRPLEKEMILGGWEGEDATTAKSLVVTWVVNNADEDSEQFEAAVSWEESLERLLLQVQKEAAARGLRVSFNTEMSLEKELNKSSNTDAKIIVISYLVMFVYVSLALSGWRWRVGVKSRFTLALFGIFVVLLSVAASVGFFAMIGIKATLIIAEVIPFLVLAVGVDNVFLLVHELDNVNLSYPNEAVERRVARAVGRIGPSILLSASCETVAFALGASVSMPAVRNFAMYSAGAVFFNAVLQLTTFVSALTLDQKRLEENRIDCFPFWKMSKSPSSIAMAIGSPGVFDKFDEPVFSKLIRKHYAPYILKSRIKAAILGVFALWLSISIALLPGVELGLDQRLAVPNDSYLVNYFNDLYEYFDTGPPVYFITQNMDATNRSTQEALCGRFSACNDFSLVNIVEQEHKRPDSSFIALPAASWIDDFFTWLNPDLDECCRVKKSQLDQFCTPTSPARQCQACFDDKKYDAATLEGLPEGDEFIRYFDQWIEAPSDQSCPLGGKAAYGSDVHADPSHRSVSSSAFRAGHTPLRSQADFINAYASARRVAELITENTGIETYPYSSFYIFFAQYATIVRDSLVLIGSALGAILVISTIILGSIKTAAVISVTVAAIVTNIAGAMALLGVGLNAVSLVNLVICVGIGVEFCVHIARAFTFTHDTTHSSKEGRAFNSLVGVGGSVLGGIALTKLIGVCVLAFTQSKIFDVYYFRMWLALVIVATAHCFVLLPVLLSYAGGVGYILDQGDQGIASDLASRVVGGDDTYSSDDDL